VELIIGEALLFSMTNAETLSPKCSSHLHRCKTLECIFYIFT